ncbi:MAG: hypothetical protein IR158_13510 [Cellulomonas sp.]|jgi:alkanesulfonate monooxygenase SsuD/methylene tetrahydromethanopterin reductase-like flavin-dependent oxidoreductase (luciferase family)|uniref:hypothetical protein n=1 Tax=Cellulomonas sp. TaxID=40001 RepID=UPI0019EFA3CD|nr:hypothetical protein [Cellulomonas sp.]MBF0688768.1 hypothetical protein [Cellulomonas sp.]
MERDEESRELSRRVKEEAGRQPVAIEVTEEQLEALRSLWDSGDPTRAAHITFTVKDRTVGEMAVAGYRYRGDTCCA